MSKSAPPRSHDELERYLPYLVNRLASLGQAAQSRALQGSGSGIGLVTMRTLSVLHIEDGLTINEIAARTFTEQSTTSRAVDAMVVQGLVERRVPPEDQRRREVVLTERGRAELAANWPAMDEYFAAIGDGISPQDRDKCRSVLARMLANLERLTP